MMLISWKRELGLFLSQKDQEGLFKCPSLLGWVIFVVRTWTNKMFFQQKLYVREDVFSRERDKPFNSHY